MEKFPTKGLTDFWIIFSLSLSLGREHCQSSLGNAGASARLDSGADGCGTKSRASQGHGVTTRAEFLGRRWKTGDIVNKSRPQTLSGEMGSWGCAVHGSEPIKSAIYFCSDVNFSYPALAVSRPNNVWSVHSGKVF